MAGWPGPLRDRRIGALAQRPGHGAHAGTVGPLGLPSLRGSMVYGVVEDTLVEWVHHQGSGLLIIGSHRHSMLEGMITGDVAKELLRTCPCPMLVVPH